MRIGYYISHFPYTGDTDEAPEDYHKGGAEIAAYHLATEMAKRGHEVHVFTTSHDSRDRTEQLGNLTLHRYAKKTRIGTSNIAPGLFTRAAGTGVDLLHAHFDIIPGPYAGLRHSKKRNTPLVVTYHGDWQEYGGLVRRTCVSLNNRFLVNRLLDSADAIISPSGPYINESRFLGRHRDRVSVIPNGIDIKDYDLAGTKEEYRKMKGLPERGDIILFLGHLSARKGPEVLIKALPHILEKKPDTSLVFVGDGGIRGELERLAAKLGIKDRVIFAGYVGDVPDKAAYYKASDVFVLPSTISTDVFPLTLLEASAAGLPMVVSDLETFRCIIDEGSNGLFSKRGDEKDLALKITSILGDDELKMRMGATAREKVAGYTWPRIAEETEKLYESLIKP